MSSFRRPVARRCIGVELDRDRPASVPGWTSQSRHRRCRGHLAALFQAGGREYSSPLCGHLCPRRLESAKARAQEYGIGAWFDDYAAMYDSVKPDGVVIAAPIRCTPSSRSQPWNVASTCCVKSPWRRPGKIVKRWSRLPNAAAPYSCACRTTAAPYRAALAYLNEATLGTFTGAEAELLLPHGPVPAPSGSADRKAEGGIMLGATVYPVSRLVGMLGPAGSVTAAVNTLIPTRLTSDGKPVKTELHDNVSLIIEWPGGQQAQLRTLANTSLYKNDSAIYGTRGTLWFSANEAVIHSPKREIPGLGSKITWNNQENCYRVPVEPMTDFSQEGLIDHFVDCILGKSQPTCGAQQQLHVHEILFKGLEAAQSGKVQRLETTFTPWHKIDPAFHDTRSRPI